VVEQQGHAHKVAMFEGVGNVKKSGGGKGERISYKKRTSMLAQRLK
jgi:hypothetical protein